MSESRPEDRINAESLLPLSGSSGEQESSSPVLDLNFVPAWARQPPAADPYARHTGRDEPAPRDRSRGRPGREGGRRQDRRPPPRGGGRERSQRPPRETPSREGRGRDPSGPLRAREERLPFMVSFIPEQNRLTAMISDIRAAQHAFPLPELAHMFLNHPEWHLVKFEAQRRPGGQYAAKMYQSKLSGLVFADYDACLKHTVDEAMEHVFKAETIELEAPSGNFVCVARCGISGEWLGPPNHHGYNKRVDELHRTRFAHMLLDEYRRHIETIHDPAVIERWRESCRTRTMYRLVEDGEEGEPMEYGAARAYVAERVAPKKVAQVMRVVLPGPLSRDIQDPGLLRLLRSAWEREQRFPVTLIRALRGAVKRMGLHFFDTKDGHTFITAIGPKPIDPNHVVPEIREVLEWLKKHPGCSRQDLIEGVRPSAVGNVAEMVVVLQPLTWLIEKGHVIEFHNGTLATPKDAV